MNILFFLHPKNEVVYLYENYSLRQALEKMYVHRYSSVPILSLKGEYLGTLSEGDILWFLKEKENLSLINTDNIYLKNLPHYRSCQSIRINQDMENLIQIAENENFVPVVDDRNFFIGIITRRDIIKYLVERTDGKD